MRSRDNALVYRSNRLIEANFQATVLQLRVWFWLISEIRPEDREFQSYRIYVRDLAQFVGIERNKDIYAQLRRATKGMMKNVLEIERESRSKRGKKNVLQVAMLAGAEYEEGEGYVSLSFHPELRPYLLDLKENFTKSKLRELLSFRGSYAIRIYELLDQYRSIGTRTIEIDDLRAMLGVGDSYAAYKNLKARVLAPAVREINERSDLAVEMVEQKKARRVVSIAFTFQARRGFDGPAIDAAPEGDTAVSGPASAGSVADEAAIERMTALGMRPKDAHALLDAHGRDDPDRIAGNCAKLEAKLAAGDKIGNPGGWLMRAIKEDWREQKTLFEIEHGKAERETSKAIKAREAQRRNAELKRERLEAELSDGERLYLECRFAFVRETVEALTQAERKAWERDFAASLRGFMAQQWARTPSEWWNRVIITEAEKFVHERTGRRCTDEAEFLRAEGRRTGDEIRAELHAMR